MDTTVNESRLFSEFSNRLVALSVTATVLVAISVLATVLRGGMEEGREEEEGGLGLKGPDLGVESGHAEVWRLGVK